jgi:hypothetical protein
METIKSWLGSLTIPIALALIASAIFFLGFGHMITSPVGLVVSAVVIGVVLYWYWNRQPSEPV